MVTLWNAESAGDALQLAHELRHAGLRVDVYPQPDKLGKQFKYAAGLGVPYVATIGDDERANHTVTLKNMQTGEQQTVVRTEVAAYISSK